MKDDLWPQHSVRPAKAAALSLDAECSSSLPHPPACESGVAPRLAARTPRRFALAWALGLSATRQRFEVLQSSRITSTVVPREYSRIASSPSPPAPDWRDNLAPSSAAGQSVLGARTSESAALIRYAHPSGSFQSSISLCSVPPTRTAPQLACRLLFLSAESSRAGDAQDETPPIG